MMSSSTSASTLSAVGAASMYSAGGPNIRAVVPESDLIADMRSDTVTTPTIAMREAMANAPVGDDVFEDDPTVNHLQSLVSTLSGHESALFCASGTMTNQLAIRTLLTNPPYSILADARSHVYCYEANGVAHHSQALIIPVKPAIGKNHLTVEEIEKWIILDDDVHHAPTRVICLENTLGGEIFPFSELLKIHAFAKKHNLKLHLDGARLWNASAATGIPMSQYCYLFDTVSLCLSKGLGAPVGSVLVGSKEVVKRAKHFRKVFGGGWRQAGGLAAAGVYAIERHFPNLGRDHEVAVYLGERLEALGFLLTRKVETNMVWFDTTDVGVSGTELQSVLGGKGVRVLGGGVGEQRWVVHHQVSREAVDHVGGVLELFLAGKKVEGMRVE
ncbi:Threonine aldolase [Podochytrium sp. JEL0797]|nr:Threonine aldolase [Podochytrium sp. JEL0797]